MLRWKNFCCFSEKHCKKEIFLNLSRSFPIIKSPTFSRRTFYNIAKYLVLVKNQNDSLRYLNFI